MKCLRKYKWVKLLRSHLPAGKGLLGYWAFAACGGAPRLIRWLINKSTYAPKKQNPCLFVRKSIRINREYFYANAALGIAGSSVWNYRHNN